MEGEGLQEAVSWITCSFMADRMFRPSAPARLEQRCHLAHKRLQMMSLLEIASTTKDRPTGDK